MSHFVCALGKMAEWKRGPEGFRAPFHGVRHHHKACCQSLVLHRALLQVLLLLLLPLLIATPREGRGDN